MTDPAKPASESTPWLLRRPFRTVAIATALFAVAGFGLSLVDGPFDPNKVGTLGEWAAGLGAVALIAFSLHEVAGARRAADAAAAERAQADRMRSDAERRAQAELVAAWYAGLTDGDLPGRILVRAVNRSTLPVYETYIEVFPSESDQGWLRAHEPAGVLGPTTEPMEIRTTSAPAKSSGTPHRPGVAISFRDAAGVYWRRSTRGELEEQPGPPHYAEREPTLEEQMRQLRALQKPEPS